MGRRKINKGEKRYVLSCYLSPLEVQMLDEIAEKQDRSRSNVIERAVIEFIKDNSDKDKNN